MAPDDQNSGLTWSIADTNWVPFTGSSNAASATNTYVVSTYAVGAAPIKAKGPETALEWLDRRIAEVRLPLAA